MKFKIILSKVQFNQVSFNSSQFLKIQPRDIDDNQNICDWKTKIGKYSKLNYNRHFAHPDKCFVTGWTLTSI